MDGLLDQALEIPKLLFRVFLEEGFVARFKVDDQSFSAPLPPTKRT